MAEPLPDFGGQLLGGYMLIAEEDSSVTHDRYEHGIFPVCIGHRNRVVNSRQVGSYAVMRARGLEHHESHEKHHDAGECCHVDPANRTHRVGAVVEHLLRTA